MPLWHPWVVALSARWGLAPWFAARFILFWLHLRRMGFPLTVVSGWRSIAHQQLLYDRWRAGRSPRPAAPPGQSFHHWGRAVDVHASPAVLRIAGAHATLFGLRWGGRFRTPDTVHFEA
jgi:hypothetical protein